MRGGGDASQKGGFWGKRKLIFPNIIYMRYFGKEYLLKLYPNTLYLY